MISHSQNTLPCCTHLSDADDDVRWYNSVGGDEYGSQNGMQFKTHGLFIPEAFHVVVKPWVGVAAVTLYTKTSRNRPCHICHHHATPLVHHLKSHKSLNSKPRQALKVPTQPRMHRLDSRTLPLSEEKQKPLSSNRHQWQVSYRGYCG